jgi:hypothetical protein
MERDDGFGMRQKKIERFPMCTLIKRVGVNRDKIFREIFIGILLYVNIYREIKLGGLLKML